MSFLIYQVIGHGNTRTVLENLLVACEQLGYGEEQAKNLLREAQEEYHRDAGQSVLERAFNQGS